MNETDVLEFTYKRILKEKEKGKKVKGEIIPGIVPDEDKLDFIFYEDNDDMIVAEIFIDSGHKIDRIPILDVMKMGSSYLAYQTGLALLIANECDTIEIIEMMSKLSEATFSYQTFYDNIIFFIFSHVAREYCNEKISESVFERLAPDIYKFYYTFISHSHTIKGYTLKAAVKKIISGSVINVFISQPMTGKSLIEIGNARSYVIDKLIEDLKRSIMSMSDIVYADKIISTLDSKINVYSNYDDINHVIQTYTDEPLKYFGQAVCSMANKDIFVFAPGWEESKGCRMEYDLLGYMKELPKIICYEEE